MTLLFAGNGCGRDPCKQAFSERPKPNALSCRSFPLVGLCDAKDISVPSDVKFWYFSHGGSDCRERAQAVTTPQGGKTANGNARQLPSFINGPVVKHAFLRETHFCSVCTGPLGTTNMPSVVQKN